MTSVTFDFHIHGQKPNTFKVFTFSGQETLTRPYRFDIDVISTESDAELAALLTQPATLTLKRDEASRAISGRITEITEAGRAAGGHYAYRLSLEPRIAFLRLSTRNRTFGTQAPMSVIDVIEAVLCDRNGLALAKDDYEVRLLKPDLYMTRDFWAQYNETDFDFFHRLLEHWGLFYYFEQSDARERIIITDSSALSPYQKIDGVLRFDDRVGHLHHDAGVARSLRRRLTPTSKTVHLKDYNEETPHVIPEVQADVPQGALGDYHEYATHFASSEEGALFASARAEEIGCAHDVFDIETTSPFVTPGEIFVLANHFRSPLNQGYLPTTVTHAGEQMMAGAFRDDASPRRPGYTASVAAIPGSVRYRSPRRIARPTMAGVMPAVIQAMASDGDRASIDEQGRYKVAINFDTSTNPVYQQSAFVRMAQPYGGTNAGMHFPLLSGTEVIVGWVDGDPDRPLIMGAVPNPQTASPVTKSNRTENKILTASGIAMIMNDSGGSEDQSETPAATPGSSAGNGQAPAGRSAAQGRPEAAASGDPTTGPYVAFIVPVASGTPPDYLRLGDIAPDDKYEHDIVADPAFKAGQIAYRDAELNNDQFKGVFDYTSRHRTTTTGGNSTTTIAGDHRLMVDGNSVTLLGGRQVTYTMLGAPTTSTPTSSTPAPKPYKYVDMSTDEFNLTVAWKNKYTIQNGLAMSYTLGATYGYQIGVDVKTSINPLGTFAFRVGPSVSVSGMASLTVVPGSGAFQSGLKKAWASGYTMSTSGSLVKGMGGLDSSTSIFSSQGKKVVLGSRETLSLPIATKAILIADLAGLAVAAAGASALIAEDVASQSYNPLDDTADTYATRDRVTDATQYTTLAVTGVAYAATLANCVSYFYPTKPADANALGAVALGQDLLNRNDLEEATVSVEPGKVVLLCGTSSITLLPDEITIAAKKVTITSTPAKNKNANAASNLVPIVGAKKSSIVVQNNGQVDMTADTWIQLNSGETGLCTNGSENSVVMVADAIAISGPTQVSGKLTAEDGCEVTGNIKAGTASFG